MSRRGRGWNIRHALEMMTGEWKTLLIHWWSLGSFNAPSFCYMYRSSLVKKHHIISDLCGLPFDDIKAKAILIRNLCFGQTTAGTKGTSTAESTLFTSIHQHFKLKVHLPYKQAALWLWVISEFIGHKTCKRLE